MPPTTQRNDARACDEFICFDSLQQPEVTVNEMTEANRRLDRHWLADRTPEEMLLLVTSAGRYCEGVNFNSFHYGFETYTLLITLGGEGSLRFRDRTLTLRRGDAIFINNLDTATMYTSDASWSFCTVNMAGSPCLLYDELWNGGGVEVIHVDNPEPYEDYRRRISRALTHKGIESYLTVNMLLTMAMTELLTTRDEDKNTVEKHPAWVTEAAAYIAAHFREPLGIVALADRFFLSPGHFTRQFKKYTGRSPKEYQTLCRVDEAALLLRGTKLSVAEIASRTGFTTQSRMGEIFRRTYGLSPLEYRKNSAENG